MKDLLALVKLKGDMRVTSEGNGRQTDRDPERQMTAAANAESATHKKHVYDVEFFI